MAAARAHIELPHDAMERVRRVYDYHRLTRHTYESVREAPYVLDWATRPNPNRVFEGYPSVPLPGALRPLDTDTLDLMRFGIDALSSERVAPPQDLHTLASWLFFSYGITGEHEVGDGVHPLRTCPSVGGLYPCEIYVAAFAIEGLEPGLYHYAPAAFRLYKLREGEEALHRIRRGRPDLEFLKTAPAAVLVSTVFWRSAWKYRDRGYRICLLDAGHVIQNLMITGAGLGIAAMARLRLNDLTMREVIGVSAEAPFGEAEAVQSMVIWADKAEHPIKLHARSSARQLPPIPRPASPAPAVEYLAVVPMHQTCVAPGMGVTEVTPPFTELAPPTQDLPKVPVAAGVPERGMSLLDAITSSHTASAFQRDPIPISSFAELNWRTFRGGTYSPLRPHGSHMGLVRPYWFVHAVAGMEPGIWVYNPVDDSWSVYSSGDCRAQANYICMDNRAVATAAATCFLVADLVALLLNTGPDAYRLAHLEAGIAAQRMALAATAMGMSSANVADFYDKESRRYLGLEHTGWELLYCTAIGYE